MRENTTETNWQYSMAIRLAYSTNIKILSTGNAQWVVLNARPG